MTLITLPRSKSQSGLAYVKSGQGPSLVLIHGVGLRLEAWMHQIETLSDYFTVYAVDMPGHGESALMPQCRDIPSYTDAIADWIRDEVKTPVLIAGHSMGSMIALNFAIRFPELCVGVVALNSVYRRSDDAKRAVIDRVQQIKESITPDNVTAPVKRWFDFPLLGDDAKHGISSTDISRSLDNSSSSKFLNSSSVRASTVSGRLLGIQLSHSRTSLSFHSSLGCITKR